VENRSRGENGGRADEERVRDASREAVVGDVILFFCPILSSVRRVFVYKCNHNMKRFSKVLVLCAQHYARVPRDLAKQLVHFQSDRFGRLVDDFCERVQTFVVSQLADV
jgi:hypothetical protein